MNSKSFRTLLILLLLSISNCYAGDFKIRPTARALFDVGGFIPAQPEFKAGVALPDVRLGALMNFDKFEARVDIGYQSYKFVPADIYLQYHINDHSIVKGGFFVHQYGIQSATGASTKIGMEAPVAQNAFGYGRLPGAMYVYQNGKILSASSLFAQNTAAFKFANELGQTGFGAMTRFVWHPDTTSGNIFHIGVSAAMQSANFSGDSKNAVCTFRSTFPTKISDVTCVSASVDQVSSIFRISPEILWSKGRVAVEGEGYFLNAARKDGLPSFRGYGAYMQTRILLNKNAKYKYSPWIGYVATPGAKSWELVAGYSYADLNCNDITAANPEATPIKGGRVNSASLTLNYYIHKYVTARLNYNYTRRTGYTADPAHPSLHTNIIQARIQFLF